MISSSCLNAEFLLSLPEDRKIGHLGWQDLPGRFRCLSRLIDNQSQPVLGNAAILIEYLDRRIAGRAGIFSRRSSPFSQHLNRTFPVRSNKAIGLDQCFDDPFYLIGPFIKFFYIRPEPRLCATAGVKKATSRLDREIRTLSAASAAPPSIKTAATAAHHRLFMDLFFNVFESQLPFTSAVFR